MFSGFVRSIDHDPKLNARETKVICQDFFLYLSRANPVIAATGATTVGSAIRAILTALEWTDSRYISLETGDSISNFSADGTKSALNLIEELLEVDRGEFFISRSGVVTYRQRSSRINRTSSATLDNVAAEAKASTDLTNVRNKITVKNESGTISEVTIDGASAANFGFSEYTTIQSDYITSSNQAKTLGQWIISQVKDPSPPLRDLQFPANISSGLISEIVTLELGDRVTVTDSALNTNADFYVEGITTQINPGRIHNVSLNLSKVETSAPLKFGTSRVRPNGEFGSPTLTAYPWDTANTSSDVFSY